MRRMRWGCPQGWSALLPCTAPGGSPAHHRGGYHVMYRTTAGGHHVAHALGAARRVGQLAALCQIIIPQQGVSSAPQGGAGILLPHNGRGEGYHVMYRTTAGGRVPCNVPHNGRGGRVPCSAQHDGGRGVPRSVPHDGGRGVPRSVPHDGGGTSILYLERRKDGGQARGHVVDGSLVLVPFDLAREQAHQGVAVVRHKPLHRAPGRKTSVRFLEAGRRKALKQARGSMQIQALRRAGGSCVVGILPACPL